MKKITKYKSGKNSQKVRCFSHETPNSELRTPNFILPLFLLFTLSLFLSSCTKEISIDLPSPEKQIVIDGGIFTGQPAEVNLTWSTGYFDPVDSTALANYLISQALVVLYDGSITDTLFVTLDPNKPIPIVWKGQNIVGQVGHTYTLKVVAEGKTATSTTTIQNPNVLDSVWFKPESGLDSLGFAWAHMTDPLGFGNGYRWFAKRITKDPAFLAPLGSAFDDKFIDGKSFDFAYDRPVVPGSTAPEDNNAEAGYYVRGDTIVVQFCTIGTPEVQFFRSLDVAISNNGNPFASPGVIKTNVSGGLGIFCGYSPSYDTIVCH